MTLNKLQIAILISATLALPAVSFAAGYSTNFNNFTPGQSLSGQEDPAGSGQFWDTNNFTAGGLGQSDFVGVIPNYSTSTSDYWAALGGISGFAPVVQTSYLFHPANLTGATNAAFNVNFAITGPQSPRTVKDTFGWTLQNSAGTQLLRVGFIPDVNQPTNLTIRVFNAANAEVLGAGSSSGLFNVFYDSKYAFNFTLNSANQYSVTVKDSLGNAPVTIINNLPAGFLASSIADIAATWTVASQTQNASGEFTNYGSNSIVFDNYVVVPEPTTMLAAFGVLGVVMTRRRRQAV